MYYVRIARIHVRYWRRIACVHIKFWFILRWFYGKERFRRYMKWVYIHFARRSTCVRMGEWVNYKAGFSGKGPTAFDVKPEIEPSRFQKWLVADEISHQKAIRYAAWRLSCMEVMGEDPEEW